MSSSQPKSAKFKKFTIANPRFHYLKIQINFDTPITTTNIVITSLTLRSLITKALADAFGIIGSGIHEEDYFFVGVIKVAKDDLTTLWNALTLFSATLNTSNNAILERSEESKDSEGHYYKDISFGVIGSSSYLMGLSGDSRRWTKSFLLKQNNKMMY
ncbi:14832_t:CDS:2 [Entrophospora sp. SA101]|nr:14832_t:CDS:2 [Entrophospora sp. SA101]